MKCVAELSVSQYDPQVTGGGNHFHGHVRYVGQDGISDQHFVEAPLSAREAKQLNMLDNRMGHDPFDWKEGMASTRFASEADLIQAAAKFCQETPTIHLCVRSGGGIQPIVFCRDPDIQAKLQAVYDEFVGIVGDSRDPWRQFPEDTARLDNAWDALIAQLPE